jgi:hypothetical protein
MGLLASQMRQLEFMVKITAQSGNNLEITLEIIHKLIDL